MAIEAAGRDRFYATRLIRAVSLPDVEIAWNDAHSTRDRVSLAIYDDVQALDYAAAGQTSAVLVAFAFAALCLTYALQRRPVPP